MREIDQALLRAAETGSLEGVRQALDGGADVNVRGAHGVTALMLAVGSGYEVLTVRLLVERGADLVAVDDRGRTAMDHLSEPSEPPEEHENGHEAWVHCEEHYIYCYLAPLLAARRSGSG